ncbi:MAG: hypothetical protein HPY64_02910 [Anaerolineae bacterium]|nr:hypothetical protein [Anaerolineae bacterium]
MRLTRLLILSLVLLALSVLPLLVASASPAPDSPADAAQAGCQYDWFFGAQARPVDACPSTPPISTDLARLEFERGEMIWVQAEQTIYVLFRDFQAPYWASYPDTFLEGMPEREAGLVGPLGLWQQPRRGFGLLWRQDATVSERLGWALEEWEASYEGWLQKAETPEGTLVFFMRDDNKVYQLHPGPEGIWELFTFLG